MLFGGNRSLGRKGRGVGHMKAGLFRQLNALASPFSTAGSECRGVHLWFDELSKEWGEKARGGREGSIFSSSLALFGAVDLARLEERREDDKKPNSNKTGGRTGRERHGLVSFGQEDTVSG